MDTIIRLALAKYRKTKTTDNSWDACQMLMDLVQREDHGFTSCVSLNPGLEKQTEFSQNT